MITDATYLPGFGTDIPRPNRRQISDVPVYSVRTGFTPEVSISRKQHVRGYTCTSPVETYDRLAKKVTIYIPSVEQLILSFCNNDINMPGLARLLIETRLIKASHLLK